MRTNCINILMAGIAACDSIIMTWMVKNDVTDYLEDECRPPSNFFVVLLEVVASGIQDILRRSSAWLSLLMALVRFLAIKNALNSKFDFLSLPIFGVKVILGAVGMSALTTLFYWCRVRIVEVEPWRAPVSCGIFPAGSTVPHYTQLIVPMFFMDAAQALKVFNVIDGALKIVPTGIFPILTFLLVQNLRSASKSRQKVFIAKGASQEENSHKTDQTTKLVILMAITYMTAEGPLAIIYLIQGFATGPLELLDMCQDLNNVLSLFVALNTVTHFLICLAVSSQYQKTVKNLFSCGRRLKIDMLSQK
ncbi:hypothetical protein CAEBREN_15459 [Caenorhabditis brenneri]|uniref:G-protein coupled receptors family 1 profile domain-containing protein n=1 Tax=Caenorhabditis brenneri TaxID=135651 RepID=G0M9S4_CAEBE|nr:hypothetical protein CAEBREN_15459 [Caenorhabditis brenneri]